MNLTSKTIVVVGACGRIGQELVGALLDAGANIVAVDHNEKALSGLQKVYGTRRSIIYSQTDITDVGSILHMLTSATQHFGGVDAAVNTAYPRNGNYGRKLFEVAYEDFCENLSLHLGGYFLFMQQCAKYSQSHDREFSLVNMSSIYGVIAPRFEVYEGTPMTMPVEYAAIKSALQHISSYVAAYMKGTQFRVNCVSPGGILDGQNASFVADYNKYCNDKGMLDAGDVVPTVLFLLSDASKYIVGQNIVVDDGFSL
jgi:NAD(P)-dependent dehydrogenase (short-subunit alcohol dehydrogenase family)